MVPWSLFLQLSEGRLERAAAAAQRYEQDRLPHLLQLTQQLRQG